jgi:hypothetical protein
MSSREPLFKAPLTTKPLAFLCQQLEEAITLTWFFKLVNFPAPNSKKRVRFFEERSFFPERIKLEWQ